MHSPWGNRGEICKTYGWTYDYLLWGISWLNVTMMMADAARIDIDANKRDENGEEIVEVKLKTKDDIKKFISGE